MLEFTAFLAAIGPVAILLTKGVDFVRGFDKGDTWPKQIWIALALAGGVAAALVTGTNFVHLISGIDPGVQSSLSGEAGKVVTGLAIGAMACFWHEPLSGWGTKSTQTP
jgi:hypothetical protein